MLKSRLIVPRRPARHARALIGGGACALAVMLAVTMQLALPLAHALHDRWAAADSPVAAHNSHSHHGHAHHRDHAHHPDQHYDHDAQPAHDSDSHHEHEESTCPTCQLFASLRAFTPLGLTITVLAGEAVEFAGSDAPAIVVPQRRDLTSAAPRAPPISC